MEAYSREEADRLGAFDETALSLDEALAAEVLQFMEEGPDSDTQNVMQIAIEMPLRM